MGHQVLDRSQIFEYLVAFATWIFQKEGHKEADFCYFSFYLEILEGFSFNNSILHSIFRGFSGVLELKLSSKETIQG